MPGTDPPEPAGPNLVRRKIHEMQARLGQPRWQARLVELSEELQGEFRLQPLLERIMDVMIDLTHAQRGFLILVEDGNLVFKVRRNIDRQTLRGAFCEVSENIARLVTKTGQVFLCENAVEDPRLVTFPSVQALGLQSILAIPFRFRKDTIGAVYLDNRTSAHAFADSNLDIVRAFASTAAQAIHVADLVTRLKLRIRQTDRLNCMLKAQTRLRSVEAPPGEEPISVPEVARERRYAYDSIAGEGPAMAKVFGILDNVIPQESTVLVTGETGTGKELIARAIHHLGPRKSAPFVPVNCAAIPETLLESELFGHTRGAFTGASFDKPGLAQLADRGTLFLDEIGDFPLPLQAKLLRVLQEGEIKPVGAHSPLKVDVRVVAATNRDLKQMTESGGFRKDLYYRLSVICIHLPPLRERPEDIPLLIHAISGRLERERKLSSRSFEPGAVLALTRHNWPGNVRELENVLERLLTFSGKSITRGQVQREINAQAATGSPLPAEGIDLKRHLERIESELVQKALRTAKNKSEAARMLRIDRTWFLRLLKKYKVDQEPRDHAKS